MKRLLSMVVCLAMLLTMLPAVTLFSAQAADDVTYTYVQKKPATIASTDVSAKGVWYNNSTVFNTTAGSANYFEVVESGNKDAGAFHVYQDNVTNSDMSIGMFISGQAAGTYTVKLSVKGDLGLLGQTCKFYPYGCFDLVSNLHDKLGTTDVAGWTEISYDVTVDTTFYYLIFSFSMYNWATDFYVDNIQLINSSGVDVLQGAGNFYSNEEVTTTSSRSGQWPLTLDTAKVSGAYSAQEGEWTAMFPSGASDNSTWPAWDSTHYGEIAADGYNDAGSLHLVSVPGKNTGIAIDAGMTAGEVYTLGFYAKGTVNSGRVLGMYANGNEAVIGDTASFGTGWNYYEHTFTADLSQLNLVASDWGNVDILIDNITLKNSAGVDLLAGYGDFYEQKEIEDVVGDKPITILDSNPGVNYQWFNHNGYVNNDTKVLEIVEEGADDVGAVHVYQPDGQTADADMMMGIRVDRVPVGTYTIQYNIKGTDLGNTDNNSNKFYLHGNTSLTNQFRVAAGTKSLSDWTTVSETFTTVSDVYYIYMMVSKYVNGADYYVDNVKLLDANGNDLLQGAGNFCTTATQEPEPTDPTEPEPTEPDVTEPTEPPEIGETIPVQIQRADPQDLYIWFNHNGYTATDDMYIEIVEEGADDVGAMHIYQTDGVTGTEDMRLKMHTGYIPAGTYTLKMKLKGTDLGNESPNDACRFYVSSNDAVFPQIRKLAGAKSVAEWTEFSQTVDTDVGAFVFSLSVSKYVNGADFYVDNLQLLDVDGNDMLAGSGNFCTVWTGEPEPVPGLLSLSEGNANAYEAPDGVWSPMYPTGVPVSDSTWPAWDDSHYAEIVPAGYRDRGSLHMKSASYKNTAVAIGVNMVPGQTYTLGMWAKGISNSGRILAQYGNGDPVIIAASTSMTADWSYYECVFTAGMTQLNLLATDWGVTNLYIDHITLIGPDGVDLLAGYGDFCEEDYRVIEPNYLVSFNGEGASASAIGQVSVEGASDPTLTLNTEEAETENALQATWSYDGVNPSYLHRYVGTADTWAGTFAKNAVNYKYLRMWVSNPGHVSLDVTLLLSSADAVNYFDASTVKLIRRDGTQVYSGANNNSGYGENSCISLPKQFAGWLSIPLNTENLLPAAGYSDVITDYANVTGMQLEIRKLATTGEGDSSEYYYILDDICLSFDITGKKQSTDDGNEYADYDTSVKGSGQVKNVIFLIGDGMGFGALDVARLDRPTLYMDTIAEKGGVAGQVETNNLYGAITDSAAAGTALATGFLTQNTVLGLTENLEPVMNLGEYMKQLDKKLGLVTTTYVLDATPAAFAAHTAARGNYTAVAMDILKLGVDVVQGGGRNYLSTQMMDEEGNALTLTELAQKQYGYTYATTTDQMNAVTSGKLWGIYEEYNMPWVRYETETDSTPTLAEMTAKTFQLLENENGFFAMIEGGQIDVGSHDNSPIDTKLETLAFDDAVKLAMDYADSHPGTLVIITADHETGGVSVGADGTVSYYTTSHSAEPVPYFAYGTGAEYFENLTVNTQINYAIRRATMGDIPTVSTSVPTENALTAVESGTARIENGIITYTGGQQPDTLTLTDAEATYAVVKYKTDETNMVGLLDEAKIYYAGDGLWHVSDVLSLSAGASHSFQPLGYIRADNYNSIDVAGKSVEIDWVGFFDSYEGACAFQAHAALTGATPSGLNGLSMTLKDNLDMNFYVAADETALETTQISLTVGETTQTLSLSDGIYDAATGNYKFSAPLAAAQMTDTVTFKLVIGEDVLETGEYTVRGYADSILSGDYNDATKTLVKEMLNYGGYAQLHFGHNTENLANDGIQGAGERQLPGLAGTEMSVADSSDVLDVYGASLVTQSKVAVRLYFTGDITDCTFAANGASLTATEKNGMYYVEIPGILPQDLDEAITITVTDANGDTLTVTYSPMDYMVRMNIRGSKTLQDLVKAMYNYHLAAEEYLAA